MSAYLQIAAEILDAAKRPLSARAILRLGYLQGLVPQHLYGRTQHKTLQARLSEDILHRRDQSAFFRTRPGQFFLRKFLTDPSLPIDFRTPMAARRRTRELLGHSALAMQSENLASIIGRGGRIAPRVLTRAFEKGQFEYVDPKRNSDDKVLVWSLATVVRDQYVLGYRIGRYRDDRDQFASKRSIFFSTLVSEDARTLFDLGGLGIANSALTAVAVDLDISPMLCSPEHGDFQHSLKFFVWADGVVERDSLLAVVEIVAPDWFEPTTRKLSLNHLHWIDLSAPQNNIEDFDPWSRKILELYS
ncbi:winged helix-turn-helix domain-containing protein [Mesorhizobium sp. M0136]|uniref:hypothetical protein n=1 Tax=Mesorhizobium sp. M0136 TaxID=2956890 RepID=UPI00333C8AC2